MKVVVFTIGTAKPTPRPTSVDPAFPSVKCVVAPATVRIAPLPPIGSSKPWSRMGPKRPEDLGGFRTGEPPLPRGKRQCRHSACLPRAGVTVPAPVPGPPQAGKGREFPGGRPPRRFDCPPTRCILFIQSASAAFSSGGTDHSPDSRDKGDPFDARHARHV